MNHTNLEGSIAKILVADDEDNARSALVRGLQLMGYSAEGVRDGKQVLDALQQEHYDIMVLDLRMPEMDGVQVMNYLRTHNLDIAVIVLTAYGTIDSAIAAVKAGAVDYLLKPQHISDIEEAIQKALKHRSSQHQHRQLVGILEEALQVLNGVPQRGEIATAIPSINKEKKNTQRFAYNPVLRRLQIYQEEAGTYQLIELTVSQAAILNYFMEHENKVITNRDLVHSALGYHDMSEKEAENIIRPHILRLRRKIESDPENPRLICTIRGAGYTFSLRDSTNTK
jgi:DNA-binding response OmpR family regulator